jgi:hypothetical protein
MNRFFCFNVLVRVVFFFLCLASTHIVFGQPRYWIGSNSNQWNDPLNWSAISGGAGGASIPQVGNSAIFDRASPYPCWLTSSVILDEIVLDGYPGVVDLRGYILGIVDNLLLETGELTSTNGISILGFTNAQTVRFSGTAMHVEVIGSSTDIYFDGSVFFETVQVHKTGVANNYSDGGNVFHGYVQLQNSGGDLFLSFNFPDIHNNDLEIINSGTGAVRIASGSFGNELNGDVIVSNTAGEGIYIGDLVFGGAVLGPDVSVLIGHDGFTTGELSFQNTQQTGGTFPPITLAGNAALVLGSGNIFHSRVEVHSPGMYLGGTTFESSAYLEKNGNSVEFGYGGAVFKEDATIVNSGTGLLFLSNVSPDRYERNVTFINQSGGIYPSFAAIGSAFEGNVILNSNSTGGIFFGFGDGTTTLQDGAQFSIGLNGFTDGTLSLNRITQLGNAAQELHITGNAILTTSNSSFQAAIDFRAPQLGLSTNTFSASVYLEKNGAFDNNLDGGNIYNGTTTIVNASGAYLTLGAFTSADTYNASVTFVKNSTGLLRPSFNTTDRYRGNVTTQANTSITFAEGTGRVVFTGTNEQEIIAASGTATPRFRRATINKTGGSLTLQTPVQVVTNFTFTRGLVASSATNFLNFLDNATATGASDLSYASGVVRKTGNDAFVFPIGADGFYRSISIAAPGAPTDQFTAQYFHARQNLGTVADPSLVIISGCEYWSLERSNGLSNVRVTLSWKEAACAVGDVTAPNDLRVTRWNGTTWTDLGNNGTTGTTTNGGLTSLAAVNNFSPSFFTLASVSALNPLPLTLLDFSYEVTPLGTNLNWTTVDEHHNDYFTILRSSDGRAFQTIGKITGMNEREYRYSFLDPSASPGRTYYKLTQTDFDRTTRSLEIILVDPSNSSEAEFFIYPNPVEDRIFLTKAARTTIVNAVGKLCFTSETETKTIDVSTFPPGYYVLRIGMRAFPFIKR